MNLGWQELLILLGIVILLFGGTKLAGLGRASGKAIREFKEETEGLNAKKRAGSAAAVAPAPDEEQPARPAEQPSPAPEGGAANQAAEGA
ncbi:MAG: twin-arginine translocase TatA/TatE family subunit [Propionibacterium acidifaciens]